MVTNFFNLLFISNKNGEELTRGTQFLYLKWIIFDKVTVTVKRELHGPDSCWSSFLSQRRKSTSAITGWFTSSGHWHLYDESPIQTSLHPPICRLFNQHNQFKPTMSLLHGYGWAMWIHPKNPHWTSKGSLNWLFIDYEQSHLSTILGVVRHALINHLFHWCQSLWWRP